MIYSEASPAGGGCRRGPRRRQGTYVHYDSEAMLAALALEAHRTGAVVVGEDRGTVEPLVTQTLADQRMLGSAVLWSPALEHLQGDPRVTRVVAALPSRGGATGLSVQP